MISTVDLFPGRYFDSVRLMLVTRDAGDMPGVDEALVAMATDLNLRLLEEQGFDVTSVATAGPDDLFVALRGVDDTTVAAARMAVLNGLTAPPASSPGGPFVLPAPRTAASAGRMVDANVALISVPGRHAFVEGVDALRSGMHVMIFSDNVSVAHEVALKREAAARRLLVMGPDCGTTIIGGVGLGFANAIEPGPIALTGASGTGIQQLSCLLDAAGIGVRHALGTGSRDLSAAVGGASTLAALTALDSDPAVEAIVVVSKPPDAGVAGRVASAITTLDTPVVTAMLGDPGVTLEGAAVAVAGLLGRPPPDLPAWLPDHRTKPRTGMLRGFFSGGTLRDEALSLASRLSGPVAIEPDAPGHRLVDYGAEVFTRGRAHPMIDPGLRLEALSSAVSDPATGVILADVVLGYGAHPDPASDLAPAVAAAERNGVPCVVSLCGSRRDPQDRERQAITLRDAGAEVYLSNAAAAQRAIALIHEAAP